MLIEICKVANGFVIRPIRYNSARMDNGSTWRVVLSKSDVASMCTEIGHHALLLFNSLEEEDSKAACSP